MVEQQARVEVVQEGDSDVLRLNYEDVSYLPSVEENPLVMMEAIDRLAENPSASRLVFIQRRYYNYDEEQTLLLREIASLYNRFVRDRKLLSIQNIGFSTDQPSVIGQRLDFLQYVFHTLLKTDPLGAYAEIKRAVRKETMVIETFSGIEKSSHTKYLDVLNEIFHELDQTKLVSLARDYLPGYTSRDAAVYKLFFRPLITPDFMYTKLLTSPPSDGEQVAIYKINDKTEVYMYNIPTDLKMFYQLIPPEFKLSEDKYELLDLAKKVIMEHQPRGEEFLDPQKLRQTFYNIGIDLLRELAEQREVVFSARELEELAEILVRHTIGFGTVELLLEDPKIQDITINSPMGQVPIFVLHEEFHECVTNIIPTREDFDGWATKFRLLSGRPLDEANPILDTEIELERSRSRVSIIGKPLNPKGYSLSFRRHRDKPWTLPLFIKNGMISPLGAGLLSFTIHGSRSHLVAGTRSSGKTSFLGSLLLEIMRRYRIVSLEDTLELPMDAIQKLGYNVQALKVRSALVKGGSEVPADEGIRTSLRLGDSALIVGEIRSTESVALYEAMRIGASANVVAGTIHGDSPYGVFDRVVNDLGVPRTSFKATDLIVMCAPIQSADGLSRVRRVVSITEVRKDWEEDPLKEGGFVDLMRYNAKTDQLEPTSDLINGESEILKSIGANVREWVGDWNAIWENIVLRGELKKLLVEYATQLKRPDLLEAEFNSMANDQYYRIAEDVREETGSLNSKEIKIRWEQWLRLQVKKLI